MHRSVEARFVSPNPYRSQSCPPAASGCVCSCGPNLHRSCDSTSCPLRSSVSYNMWVVRLSLCTDEAVALQLTPFRLGRTSRGVLRSWTPVLFCGIAENRGMHLALLSNDIHILTVTRAGRIKKITANQDKTTCYRCFTCMRISPRPFPGLYTDDGRDSLAMLPRVVGDTTQMPWFRLTPVIEKW